MGASAGRYAHAHAPAHGHGNASPDLDPCANGAHDDPEAYLDACLVGDLYALAAADHHEWCLRVRSGAAREDRRRTGGAAGAGDRGGPPLAAGEPGDARALPRGSDDPHGLPPGEAEVTS